MMQVAGPTRNCGNCKHRGDEPLERGWGGGGISTFYECKRVSHDQGEQYKEGARAVVIDGSGYHARLCVENTFWCLLWEQK